MVLSLQSLILTKINKTTIIKDKYLYKYYNKEFNYIQILKKYIDISILTKLSLNVSKLIKYKISVRMFIYLIKFNLLSDDYINMYNSSLKYMDKSWNYGCIEFFIISTNRKIWYLFTNTNIPVMIHNDDIDENGKLKPAFINNNCKKCYLNHKYIYDY
jgi:hypothetical protein